MARHVIGATAEELNALRDRMTRMLKANGPPPDGKWAEFAVLEPVRDYKARHASTLVDLRRGRRRVGADRRARGGLTRPRRRRERDRSRAASRRPCADPLLSAHTFRPHRPAVPIFADLFGVCGRGDRAPWPLGGLLDGPGARVSLPPLGRLGLRSRARSSSPERLMGATVALWTLAPGRVSLASAASRPLWTGAVPDTAQEI